MVWLKRCMDEPIKTFFWTREMPEVSGVINSIDDKNQPQNSTQTACYFHD